MSQADLYRILIYTSGGSLLVPLISCLIKLKTLNTTLRVLLIYLLIATITEVLSFAWAGKDSKPYYILQNTFTLLETFLFAYLYYLEFTSKRARRIVLGLLFTYILSAIILFRNFKSYAAPDNIICTLECCLMIAFAISFFYKVHKELNIPKLTQHYFIHINSGILIYFSTSLILFLFLDYFDHCSRAEFQRLWSLHLIANITYNIFFTVGIWKQK